MNQFEYPLLTDDHGGRGAAIGNDVQWDARENHIGSVGNVRFHRPQVFRGNRRRIRNPRLVDGHPRHVHHEFEFVLHAVIGRKHHQANTGPCCDAVIHREGNILEIDEILRSVRLHCH